MLLFLYGTLKRGGSNHGYMRGQRFVAEARTVPRYKLYDLGGYPGMVLADTGGLSITGEIWEVDNDGLARLDELEDIEGGEYSREPVTLLPPHQDLEVQVYRYLFPVTGCRELGATW
ncbi:gamma-glutamylcyclotransferase family protein [Prosthecobacter sp. SYSU 5D2]|uniref:gamma-glutamylcyclotransferase family protein n=1 Tax=Prosthecobacter sp. SYSU 5D2 TaxID=3134134 RepID=UPI0031FE97F5